MEAMAPIASQSVELFRRLETPPVSVASDDTVSDGVPMPPPSLEVAEEVGAVEVSVTPLPGELKFNPALLTKVDPKDSETGEPPNPYVGSAIINLLFVDQIEDDGGTNKQCPFACRSRQRNSSAACRSIVIHFSVLFNVLCLLTKREISNDRDSSHNKENRGRTCSDDRWS